jgi:TetR/AcrR family transcriptional repressor of nem operon
VRYSSEHRQQTRERIVQEAAREVRAKGPDGVAIAGVMARAGLTHGGFYAHFPSKDALVAEAVGAMFADARGRSDALDTLDDPKAALREYLQFYLSRAHRDGRDRGCPLPALSGDIARSPGAVRPRFAEGIGALSARLAELLTRIGAERPEAEANALLAQLVGAVSLARAIADTEQSDAILRDTRDQIIARYRLDAA